MKLSKLFSISLMALTCVILIGCTSMPSSKTSQPNIVVIFVDDMGYGDMSCNGHPTIKTPNLDRMAAEGQKWTSFYVAASVCTPSRAGLMTGRYPVRSGMCSDKKRVLFPDSLGGLPAAETTMAEMLKARGYATAMVGKWHLGHLPQFLPVNNGFDSWYGIPYSNDMDGDNVKIKAANKGISKNLWIEGKHWKEPRSEYWNVPLMEGETILQRSPNQELLTKTYTEKSIDFIRTRKSKPFFLYLAHSMPHVPLFRSDAFKDVSTAGLYGDVIEEVDWSVGQIMRTLRDEGLAENTLVVFTSDNGPWLRFKTLGGIAGPLRGGKGSTWDGGMREPCIFWWPGTIQPGIVHGLGSTLDLLPTTAAISGATLPQAQLDGYNLLPSLLNGKPSPRREMIYYRGQEIYAIRLGSFKAHFKTRSGYENDLETHNPPLLFNLDHDPGENYNVADKHPDVLKQIEQLRKKHEAGVKPVEDQLAKR
ncbi:MAG: sulfatase [Kiritimatiellales bacterium]|nr:sulfatase [Kiritimatiellales bacterium]